MKKFEYKILEIPAKGFWGIRVNFEEIEQKLNELGKAGWEAITHSADMNASSKRTIIIILKREIN
jgi:hypothetical protein